MALPVLGLRRFAFLCPRRDGIEQKVRQLYRRPQVARFIIVVAPDPNEIGMLFLQLADGGVQVLVPAADLDFVLAVDVADGGFFFGS